LFLDYEALDLFILKENLYGYSEFYYTSAGSFILVFCMLFVVLFYMSYKYIRVSYYLKKEAKNLKVSLM